MHALLGFGSLCLSWDRSSQDAKSLAYQHGAVALQGLQNAISAFSQVNADAVLATSVLLSWQANDFKAWQSLISGIRTVRNNSEKGTIAITDKIGCLIDARLSLYIRSSGSH